MAAKNYTKLKLLYILDYLQRFSDDENPVGAEEIQEFLKTEKEIDCEIKSIYSDVKTLKDHGCDIIRTKAPKNGYYIGNRDFQLPEIRLLIDAIQSANFISVKKSNELIDKIYSLCSKNQAEVLKKQILTQNKLKCTNEEIYYSIDIINKAIKEGKQIRYQYYKKYFDEETGMVELKEKTHVVNPYGLLLENNYYYLISNHVKHDNLMHTRIDRMKKVEIVKYRLKSYTSLGLENLSFPDYKLQVFNMFSGDIEQVKIIFDESVLEQVLDRFGSYANVYMNDDKKLVIKSSCAISEGLVSWLIPFGTKLKVVEPQSLVDMIVKRAKDINENYSEFINEGICEDIDENIDEIVNE